MNFRGRNKLRFFKLAINSRNNIPNVSSGLKVIKNKPAGVIPDLSEVVCVAYVYVA